MLKNFIVANEKAKVQWGKGKQLPLPDYFERVSLKKLIPS